MQAQQELNNLELHMLLLTYCLDMNTLKLWTLGFGLSASHMPSYACCPSRIVDCTVQLQVTHLEMQACNTAIRHTLSLQAVHMTGQ